jgi:hypothetical protein
MRRNWILKLLGNMDLKGLLLCSKYSTLRTFVIGVQLEEQSRLFLLLKHLLCTWRPFLYSKRAKTHFHFNNIFVPFLAKKDEKASADRTATVRTGTKVRRALNEGVSDNRAQR